MSDSFQHVLAEASKQKSRGKPPVHLWDPPFCGDIDIKIAADGSWYHEGRIFQRQSLVELLASIMKREGDEYFLVSPVEKVRIQVEDAPFVVLRYRSEVSEGLNQFVFESNVGDSVVLDCDHPLRVVIQPETGEPRPYIMVRDGLEALIHRNVFYQLVAEAQTQTTADGERFYLESAGQQFELGVVAG